MLVTTNTETYRYNGCRIVGYERPCYVIVYITQHYSCCNAIDRWYLQKTEVVVHALDQEVADCKNEDSQPWHSLASWFYEIPAVNRPPQLAVMPTTDFEFNRNILQCFGDGRTILSNKVEVPGLLDFNLNCWRNRVKARY